VSPTGTTTYYAQARTTGTSCVSSGCAGPVTVTVNECGACCLGGGCLEGVERTLCETQLQGVFAGANTTCAAEVCVPGACCSPTHDCTEIVEAACTQAGGTFGGRGVSCSAAAFHGACCVDGLCRDDRSELECAELGGLWTGCLSNCSESPGPCDPRKISDFNHDGAVDAADLLLFVDCASGPSVAYESGNLPVGCTVDVYGNGLIAPDFDRDHDVDQIDFATIQRCLTMGSD